MLWSMVRMEPFGLRDAGGGPCCLCLHLPLISDGRLSLVHLMRTPERASVKRHYPDLSSEVGAIRLIDNQLTCVWQHFSGNRPPDLRVIGSNFGLGAKIALRSPGSVIALFEVCELKRENGLSRAS